MVIGNFGETLNIMNSIRLSFRIVRSPFLQEIQWSSVTLFGYWMNFMLQLLYFLPLVKLLIIRTLESSFRIWRSLYLKIKCSSVTLWVIKRYQFFFIYVLIEYWIVVKCKLIVYILIINFKICSQLPLILFIMIFILNLMLWL